MSKMIPLHVADQAVAACEAEIQKLREENARLKCQNAAYLERLVHLANRLPGGATLNLQFLSRGGRLISKAFPDKKEGQP